jgi:hypothetical protein
MTTIAIFGLALISNAQIPSYVPSTGLISYWTFDGNGNDLIGLNNLTTNGAVSYDMDRFGNINSAALFDNNNEYFSKITPTLPSGNSSRSLSFWYNSTGITYNAENNQVPFAYGNLTSGTCYTRFKLIMSSSQYYFHGKCKDFIWVDTNNINIWIHIVLTYDVPNNSISLFKNGVLNSSRIINGALNTPLDVLQIGLGPDVSPTEANAQFDGKLDEVAFYDRVLTQQEISDLYNSTNCSNNLAISPANNQLQTGATANFIATTLDTFPSYVWQSDLGQGFQTLNNYGNYSGTNTNSLSISNVQLPNHTQPIRVISTSGECIDTSNVATINITDTCIVTINDTITTLISVTDTLLINTLITGLTPPNNSNTIKVFPNPANSHITIDFGNFESMIGYTLTITNSIGQTVYTTPINEQSSYVDLSTWSGNGIYFVQIIDTQNNTIENRKIVLQ